MIDTSMINGRVEILPGSKYCSFTHRFPGDGQITVKEVSDFLGSFHEITQFTEVNINLNDRTIKATFRIPDEEGEDS